MYNDSHKIVNKLKDFIMPKLPSNYISAERLVKLFLEKEEKENYKYIIELNSWIFFYKGKVWTADNAYDDLYIALENIIEEKDAIDFWDNEKIIKKAILNLQRRPYFKISLKDLDAHDNLLNCNNGVLNLDTLELIPHGTKECKDLLITKITNVDYNKDAVCPKFKSVIWDLFAAYFDIEEAMDCLQRIFGYSLSGYNYLQYIYFLQGSGANGKTTLAETIFNLLGSYALNYHKKYFIKQGSMFDRAYNLELHGARFILIRNFDSDDRLEESIIKQTTGGDTIQFNINGHSFNYKLKGKLFCIANDMPRCSKGNLAISRRLFSIPFFSEFDGKNYTLNQVLKEEYSGILNWLIEGFKNINITKTLHVSEEMKHLSDCLMNETIPKSSLLIDRYLKRYEEHVMNIEQAELFIDFVARIKHNVLKKNDFKPSLLGKMLKKKSLGSHYFNTREKFYWGVGLDKELFEKDFGMELSFNGMRDTDLKLTDTHINKQILFYETVIENCNRKMLEQDEWELYHSGPPISEYFNNEPDKFSISAKAKRNLDFLKWRRENVFAEKVEDELAYCYKEY